MAELQMKEQTGKFRFTFNGNIITELGEESISNSNIAIAELIKNAYDANSEQVSFEFVNLGKHNTTIRIVDGGVGMGLTDIKDKFMDIGSPHKKDIVKTPEYNRVSVGAKGIGRFASHSLGNKLLLKTAVKGEKTGYELKFDWKLFDKHIKATDVDVPMITFNKKNSERGTTLEILDLKESWNDNTKLKQLLKDLKLLVCPIDPPRKFKIKNNIPTDDLRLPDIKKKFFDLAAYEFRVKLTKKKELHYEFYKLGKLKKNGKQTLARNLTCGDAEFRLFSYYKVPAIWKQNTGKEIDKTSMDYIKSVLGEYSGIKLYRDHFRVKPYGDVGADWIGLDVWSRNQTDVPGNPQVLGIVSISKEQNPKIEDTTTREGVINNTEYYDLVEFVTTSIREFTILKNTMEPGRKKGKRKKKQPKTIKVEKAKSGASPATKQPFLIDVKGSYPSSNYDPIVFEANECNERNYPNAAFWLSRKIIENLVTHILSKKYPSPPDLWYDHKKQRVLNLSQLIDNLHDNRNDFTAPGLKHQIEIFKSDVTPMRKAVNCIIHNNYDFLTDRADLKKYKINKIVQNLIDIYSKTIAMKKVTKP